MAKQLIDNILNLAKNMPEEKKQEWFRGMKNVSSAFIETAKDYKRDQQRIKQEAKRELEKKLSNSWDNNLRLSAEHINMLLVKCDMHNQEQVKNVCVLLDTLIETLDIRYQNKGRK